MGKGMELAKDTIWNLADRCWKKKFPAYVSRIACGFVGGRLRCLWF